MDVEDLYAVLGLQSLGPRATVCDVRKAYKARALALHPDKQVGKTPAEVAAAASEFDKVLRAIGILGDETAKKAYDLRRQSCNSKNASNVHNQRNPQSKESRRGPKEDDRELDKEIDEVMRTLREMNDSLQKLQEEARKWSNTSQGWKFKFEVESVGRWRKNIGCCVSILKAVRDHIS